MKGAFGSGWKKPFSVMPSTAAFEQPWNFQTNSFVGSFSACLATQKPTFSFALYALHPDDGDRVVVRCLLVLVDDLDGFVVERIARVKTIAYE